MLESNWRWSMIDLSSEDLSNVIGGFACVFAAADNDGGPITVQIARLSVL